MPQQRICDLTKDERFEGYLLVRSAEQRTDKNGAKYLDINLADCTGELNAKVWDGSAAVPTPGTTIKIRGTIQEYNGRVQLRIERMRPTEPADPVDLTLLTPCAPEPPEEMLKELNNAIDGFQSEPLRCLTRELLRRFSEKLNYYPAAQRIHHAERSGLLHHTTSMLRLARAILPVYPWLNADLLFAGVIVHDICKTEEIDSDKLGVVRDYSREGLLLGHLVLGVTRIQEAADKLGLTGEPVLLLQHMMLSHHGEAEYGSPRPPMIPEADMLHWLDIMDAHMNEMQTAVGKLKPGVFSERMWSLDRRLYHAEYDSLNPKTEERDVPLAR